MQLSPVEAWCFGAIAAAAIAFVSLEKIAPYNRGQSLVRPGFWVDFAFYGFVQSWALAVLIGRLIALLDAGTGLSRLALVSQWPVLAQVAFFVVTHDLYIYLMHRAQHASPFLWRFHEAHHSVPQVDWLSGVRSHPVEILVNQTIEFAPIVLLGASPEVAPIKGAVSAIWGMFIHSNWDVRLGMLRYVLNGPEMHRWHHADQPEAYGKNFATKLSLWDWLFGTAFNSDGGERKAERYGLGYAGFPEGYPGQVLRAFGRGPFDHEPASVADRPEGP